MTLRRQKDGRRTVLYDDDDLHVGTIWEVASAKESKAAGQPAGGIYNWYVRNHGGRAASEDEAVAKIEEELAR